MEKYRLNVKQMALIGLMTAVICVIAPFSLNIPVSPVPISLGSMAIYFVITVLGMWRGTICVLLYILLGFVGLPVFTNFSGGVGKVLGPTGGYIVGYVFLALIFGFFVEHWKGRLVMHIIGAALGTIVMYFFGTLWLAYLTHMGFVAALWAGVIPYIPGDIVKLAVSMAVGIQLRKRLVKAELL
ncbi:MAG: biotin transporter BioY [Butyrivibrio sp.]|nr:biotin transporter BioY [Muribaculum sp.]MCM1552650.1 biotin transporter BioY [Butyrivibrio sp.]